MMRRQRLPDHRLHGYCQQTSLCLDLHAHTMQVCVECCQMGTQVPACCMLHFLPSGYFTLHSGQLSSVERTFEQKGLSKNRAIAFVPLCLQAAHNQRLFSTALWPFDSV